MVYYKQFVCECFSGILIFILSKEPVALYFSVVILIIELCAIYFIKEKAIYKDFKAILKGENMIELVNVSKKIQDKLILEKVSLSIGAGEFIAVVGESGSGKTTLLNVIGHLDSKDSGQVIINEMEYQITDCP